MGGMHGFGPVVEPGGDEPYHEPWEARVFALHLVIGPEGLTAGPGGRPTRETMAPADYLAASYFERWLWSAERMLERAGTVVPGEVEEAMGRLRAGGATPRRDDPAQAERARSRQRSARPMGPARDPRFDPGDAVRVRRMRPPGHTRCPRYARGAVGTVEAVHGEDRLPDRAVYGEDVAPEPVYSVVFGSDELWGGSDEPPFAVALDLWESYLQPVP